MECKFTEGCMTYTRVEDILKFTEDEFKAVYEIGDATNIPEGSCYRLVRQMVNKNMLLKRGMMGKMPGDTLFKYKNVQFLTTEDRELAVNIKRHRKSKNGRNWEVEASDMLFDWMKPGQWYTVRTCIDHLIDVVSTAHFALDRYYLGHILSNDKRFEKSRRAIGGRTQTVYRKVV